MFAQVLRNLSKCHVPALHTQLRAVASVTTADVLLSEENQQRTIDCLQHAKPLGVNLQQHRSEKMTASVMILLCTTASHPNEVSILYTRRSVQLSRHVRQISFPGGIRDPTDVDFVDCALRETEEEVGLPRSRVQIWGTGSVLEPPRTAAITPVVGVVEDFDLSELHLNAQEVEEAFTIPVAQLLSHNSLRYTQFRGGYSAPAFVVGHYKIWGVTGVMTNRFLKCLVPRQLNRLHRHVRFVRPYKHQHQQPTNTHQHHHHHHYQQQQTEETDEKK